MATRRFKLSVMRIPTSTAQFFRIGAVGWERVDKLMEPAFAAGVFLDGERVLRVNQIALSSGFQTLMKFFSGESVFVNSKDLIPVA